LKYGSDCDGDRTSDAVVATRLRVTALPGGTGWVVKATETTATEPRAYLCRIPQRGKRVAKPMGEFIAPVRLEFSYQPNP
ncbi:MAG: hypothetical protein V3U13_02495, partial [Gemmatimonadota bacterium]